MKHALALALFLAGCATDDPMDSAAASAPCAGRFSVRTPPTWLRPGPFTLANNPHTYDLNQPAWRANSATPERAIFTVPFTAGDKILGIAWDAFGAGGDLAAITVYWQAGMDGMIDAGTAARLVTGATDRDRPAAWGTVDLSGPMFRTQTLTATSNLWVEVEERGDYYIGDVTATYERSCP